MANDELSFLPKTPEEARAQLQEGESTLSDSQKAEMKQQPGWRDIEPEIKHEMARRKDTELTVRWAQHYVHCIGSGSTAECKAEKAKLDSEQYPFGRIGLMILEHPTHEGDKEAKHWVPVRLEGGGSGEIRKD
jgi:hypothetical protein